MITFKRIKTDGDVAAFLAGQIAARLKTGRKVLWLIAGGSAMGIAVKTTSLLDGLDNLTGLAVSLTDERYGPAGHKDSNWKQLRNMGFSLPGARLQPVLEDKDLQTTAKDYQIKLLDNLARADYSLALAGMGPDGHIFGIKPGSPAVDDSHDVCAYQWDDFTRLTPTIKFIKKLDEVIIYAAGAEKHPQIDMLDRDIPVHQQPAQLLKRLSNVTFFNDYKGEET